MFDNYFNEMHPLKPYSHTLPAIPGTPPAGNARREDSKPFAPKGFWPGFTANGWILIEDYRGKAGWVNGEAVTINDFGPLPEGWSDEFMLPPLTPEEKLWTMQYTFLDAIQQRLDDFAKTRGCDNMFNVARYTVSTDPQFYRERQYVIEARDATWCKAHEILNAVFAGKREMPALEMDEHGNYVSEVFAELPALRWPDEEAEGYLTKTNFRC